MIIKEDISLYLYDIFCTATGININTSLREMKEQVKEEVSFKMFGAARLLKPQFLYQNSVIFSTYFQTKIGDCIEIETHSNLTFLFYLF